MKLGDYYLFWLFKENSIIITQKVWPDIFSKYGINWVLKYSVECFGNLVTAFRSCIARAFVV
jgi:hypothetical protein